MKFYPFLSIITFLELSCLVSKARVEGFIVIRSPTTKTRRNSQTELIKTPRLPSAVYFPISKRQGQPPPTLFISRLTNDQDRSERLPGLAPAEDISEDSMENLPFEWVGLGTVLTSLTAFILVNQFLEPWPMALFTALPPPAWLLIHYLGGVMFAGGIVVSTALEWLVVETTAQTIAAAKDNSCIDEYKTHQNNQLDDSRSMAPVLDFLFERVPVMDAALVVPGLALALVSGVSVATAYYGGLGISPPHIVWAFRVLVAFAIWWAVTDVATQGPAAQAVQQWKTEIIDNDNQQQSLPSILYRRRISNIGSCLFVVALYAIMALKPGL